MDWNSLLHTIASACVSIALRLVVAAIILVVGRALIRFVLKKLKKFSKLKDVDPTAQTFLFNITRFGLYALLLISVVGTLGVEMASIIALVASAGAAIALAVKGSFSNLVGGIMLLIFKPISNGDFVEISGKSGTVEEIGMFYTQLKTADNLTVNIPNAIMTDTVIVNYSRKDTRRLDLVLSVAYGTDLDRAKAVVEEVVCAHEMSLKDPAPFIRLTEMGDSALQITIRVWCDRQNFGVLKSDLLEALNRRMEEEGIEIPFPQLTIHSK